MAYQKVPFRIQPVVGWTIGIYDDVRDIKYLGRLRVFDTGGWEFTSKGTYLGDINTGGRVRWLRGKGPYGRGNLAMNLDNGTRYYNGGPFGTLFSDWTAPLISLGSFFDTPPQPWFSHSGKTSGVFDIANEETYLWGWKLQ